MNVTSYELNRRGDIDNKSAVGYTKLSDAINAKKENNDGLIVFVSGITADIQSKVTALVDANDMQLYPTKKREMFILGNKASAKVECAVE